MWERVRFPNEMVWTGSTEKAALYEVTYGSNDCGACDGLCECDELSCKFSTIHNAHHTKISNKNLDTS